MVLRVLKFFRVRCGVVVLIFFGEIYVRRRSDFVRLLFFLFLFLEEEIKVRRGELICL